MNSDFENINIQNEKTMNRRIDWFGPSRKGSETVEISPIEVGETPDRPREMKTERGFKMKTKKTRATPG